MSVERAESSFRGYKDIELFFQTWTNENPTGTLVVTHGLSEHSECYSHFAEGMVGKGWDVLAWDLRGHGRSEGKRGFVESFEDFSRDLACLVEVLQRDKAIQKKPMVLVGHSMGGLTVFRTLIDYGNMGAAAACLSSPQLGISMPVPKIKDMAAKVIVNIVPRMTMYNEVRYEDLTHDKAILRTYPADPLRHEKISPGLYLGMIENMDYVSTRAGKITLPVFMQLSGIDKIVSTPKAQEFYDNIGSELKNLKVYPNSYHEIYNDVERAQVFTDLDNFLKKVIDK
jgi:alpha-beta hydrolase superfamily lysophospholipase